MQLNEATLNDLLKGTSRAFYLSLAILPSTARPSLSLAYLIARAADTIADAPAARDLRRSEPLERLRQALLSTPSLPADSPHGGLDQRLFSGTAEEQRLLASVPALLELLEQRPPSESAAIRQVVSTLIEGMLWDQRLFGAGQNERGQHGLDDAELEEYTYLVAGCVGPFWSEICALSDPHLSHLAAAEHHHLATEFGKGLQWVNILRDVADDHRSGRFYLPHLSSPDFHSRYRGQARRAIEALATASPYPLLFPRHYLRHRMAVFWPLVLGFRTVEKLLTEGGPRPRKRVKVKRWEVLFWVAAAPLIVTSDRALKLVLNKLGRRAERALSSLEVSDG